MPSAADLAAKLAMTQQGRGRTHQSGAGRGRGMSRQRRVGSRAEVMHGTAARTSGGLTKTMLKYNKQGRIVSVRASTAAKKANRLAGYTKKRFQKGGGRQGDEQDGGSWLGAAGAGIAGLGTVADLTGVGALAGVPMQAIGGGLKAADMVYEAFQ